MEFNTQDRLATNQPLLNFLPHSTAIFERQTHEHERCQYTKGLLVSLVHVGMRITAYISGAHNMINISHFLCAS